MLYQVLLALRIAGSTLHQLTSFTKRHAHLVHLVFRVNPFLPTKRALETAAKSPDAATKFAMFYDYSVADAFLHLVVALVSANTVFLSPALDAVWRLVVYGEGTDPPPPRLDRIHATLATILRLVPKGNLEIFPIVESSFPFRGRPGKVLSYYTLEALRVLDYVPTMEGQLLGLILDKCLEMDVEIKIEEGGVVGIDEQANSQDDDELFQLDLDEPESASPGNVNKEDQEAQVDEMADKVSSHGPL